MKLLVVLACLLAGCLAQRPHACTSPPLLTGEVTVATANEKLLAFAKYEYDALGERMRFREIGTFENKTFSADILMVFREKVMYEINEKQRSCKKVPLKVDFQPMAIPKSASLVGQVVLGASSGPGEGLLVNTWRGDLPTGEYIGTVTEFGCIPVSVLYQSKELGWMVINIFNNVIGITDPIQLDAPSYCPQTTSGEEPVHFHNAFFRKN